jgi:hypothetical protein
VGGCLATALLLVPCCKQSWPCCCQVNTHYKFAVNIFALLWILLAADWPHQKCSSVQKVFVCATTPGSGWRLSASRPAIVRLLVLWCKQSWSCSYQVGKNIQFGKDACSVCCKRYGLYGFPRSASAELPGQEWSRVLLPSPSAPTGPSKWTRAGQSYICHPPVYMRESTRN